MFHFLSVFSSSSGANASKSARGLAQTGGRNESGCSKIAAVGMGVVEGYLH
jgi:hypothetical protein